MSQPYARDPQHYAGPTTEYFSAPQVTSPEPPDRPYAPAYHPQVTYTQGPPHPFESEVAQPFHMAPGVAAPATREPRWLIGLGVVVVVLVLGCVGAFALLGFGAKSVSDTIMNDQRAALADAKVSSCSTDAATGLMGATVTITNHGSDQASYLVDVTFQSVGGKQRLDSTVATAEDLAAGQTATVDARALTEPKGRFTCKITSVTRI